jgi:hypothetical protein
MESKESGLIQIAHKRVVTGGLGEERMINKQKVIVR